MMPQKITFLVGDMEAALASRLAATGETPSRYLRRIVAADLGRDPPEMRGQVANLRQYAAKRTKKRKGRK
jgi:hypothetical protein